jgi:transcriptional regulator GlxA family with amidase domain
MKQRNPAKVVAAPRRKDGILDVTIVLLAGGYLSTAIGPIEVFHSAGVVWNWLRGQEVRPRFRVRVASLDGKRINGLCSLGIVPECSIHDVKHTDIIIVPAPGWDVLEEIARNSDLVPWLKKWHARGAYIAGVCSGVAFLAEAGLLDGKQATTHWGVADIMRQRYPRVDWKPENFVTEDGKVFCSGGVYAAIDLSLYLVEKFCGHEVALEVAKSLLLSMPRSRQSGYAVVPLSRHHADEKIRDAEEYLQKNFERGVSIEELADRAGMGVRNFIRRFKAATGHVPGAYLQTLRVAAAKEMLEAGVLSIQEICSKVGYEDVAFFRELFKRHTGMTPAEYRHNFAGLRFERGELVAGNAAARG